MPHTLPTSDFNPAQYLTFAQAELQHGRSDSAHAALRQALAIRETRLAAHNLIEQHGLPGGFSQMMGLDCRISPQDDIYRFFEGHPTSINPLRDYLADGWRTLSELMLLLESVDRPLLRCTSFLEFASGHGRFTRHLVKALGAERVTVSDVVPDAVEFSRGTFDVAGFVSSTVPEEVQWPRRFDVVFVLSLFSHLPRHTWARWLRHLFSAVAPGGVLVLSAHGPTAAARDQVTLDADGFFFAASSESQAIDVQEYGTTFTSQAFVRQCITDTLGATAQVHSVPVHFWNHQDAYVIRHP